MGVSIKRRHKIQIVRLQSFSFMSQLVKRADVKGTPSSMCTTRLMMSASPTPPEKQAIRNQNINKLPLKKRFNANSSEFDDKQENDEHIKGNMHHFWHWGPEWSQYIPDTDHTFIFSFKSKITKRHPFYDPEAYLACRSLLSRGTLFNIPRNAL